MPVALSTTAESDVSIKEYNASSGSEGWSTDHGALVRGVATDDNGNVYIGGLFSGASTFGLHDWKTRRWREYNLV